MRRQLLTAILCGCLITALSGCSSAPAAVLPTTTPAPTQIIPTTTATFLPPPTVTSFPTATPRGTGQPQEAAPDITAGGLITSEAPAATLAPAVSDTPAPPTATLAPTAPPEIPDGVSVGSVLYTTTFQGWPTANDPGAKLSFADGHYLFELSRDARYFTTLAASVSNQPDVYAQMTITPKQCPAKTKTGYGLIFRYADSGNYYLLTVFCDKSYTIGGKDSGSIFGNTGTLPGDLDPTSSEAHSVGVMVHGYDYTLYFDKQPIGTFQDNRRPKGDVGIYAMSQADEVLQVTFDSLKVWTLN
jgi:hypothetical protein